MALPAPIWISEADVVSLMDLPDAIAALESGLRLEAGDQARNMLKTQVSWDEGSTLHAIGAVFPGKSIAGTKTWTHTKGGATPLLMLFDSKTGSLLSVIEAFALGQMRTGGISGVATKWLARPESGVFAILGTGKQAITQVAAVIAVRPVKRIHVYGRDQARTSAFAERVEKEFGVPVIAEGNVETAVRDANIITVVTRATEPIVTARMIAPGTHINGVGAIIPGRSELAPDLLKRADSIVVDNVSQARMFSSELIEYCGNDDSRWNSIRSLAEIVAAGNMRTSSTAVTIFKSLGMGISDLSLGIEIYERALRLQRGREFAHPQKASPSLAVPIGRTQNV